VPGAVCMQHVSAQPDLSNGNDPHACKHRVMQAVHTLAMPSQAVYLHVCKRSIHWWILLDTSRTLLVTVIATSHGTAAYTLRHCLILAVHLLVTIIATSHSSAAHLAAAAAPVAAPCCWKAHNAASSCIAQLTVSVQLIR
jgi:hypothetical protein